MDIWIILLLTFGACIWLALKDIAAAYAPATATGMIAPRHLAAYALVFIVAGGVIWATPLARSITAAVSIDGYYCATVIFLSAAVATYACRRIGSHNSLIYGILGAMAGWALLSGHKSTDLLLYRMPFSWLAAPLIAALIAAANLRLYRLVTKNSQMHILKLAYWLRWVLAGGIVLLSVAIGINNGGLLMAFFSSAGMDFSVLLNTLHINEQQTLWIVAVVAAYFLVRKKIGNNTDRLAEHDLDIDTPSAISVVYSTGLVLLLFSLPSVCDFVGLQATPLAVPHLILGAIAGTAVMKQRHGGVDFHAIIQAGISMVVTSLVAFGIAYAAMSINLGYTARISQEVAMPRQFNLTIPILGLLFASAAITVIVLMRKSQKVKLDAHNTAIEQQQRLLEKQKDVTSLEIKQILIENESLNNRLELRRNELINIALNIGEQRDFLENADRMLKRARACPSSEGKDEIIAEIESMVMHRMSFSQESESLYAQVEMLHKDFGLRLSEKFPRLTTQERKMTTLLRLGFSTKYIAALMNISPKSVDMGRYRLRAKFGLHRDQKLGDFIKTI